MQLVDMHLHTRYSDGLYTVAEIIDKIIDRRLGGFVITDHDSFDSVPEAVAYRNQRQPSLFMLFGCEFSTRHPVLGELHILGYFTDDSYTRLQPLLQDFKQARLVRAQRMLEKFAQLGISIRMDELVANPAIPIGRMHIARLLVQKGHVANVDQAFEKYLRGGALCYVPKEELSSVEIIQLIHKNHGKPVLAHPTVLYQSRNWEYVRQLIREGLSGIECWHPRISSDLARDIEKQLGATMLLTGGSDYHGDPDQDQVGKYGLAIEVAQRYFG